MKLKSVIVAAIIAAIPATSYAQSRNTGLDSPITKAVMEVYRKQIEENPQDYETYFRRANEYYRHSDYLRALSDIDNAIKYTPHKESDMRFQEYTLRANIYTETKRYKEALADLKEALKIDPRSYVTVYQKANMDFEMGNYAEAKEGYRLLQRLNNRSQEALFGLARVAVKENNIGLADEYIEQAVAMNPASSDVYVRRASVYRLMGNVSAAADDLILAISTDRHNNKALQGLVDLSDTDYATVISALSNAIRQAPRVGMFYYIRAVIAQDHFKYIAAINDLNKIIAERLYDYAGLYASLAECYYALGNFTEALHNIDYAIGSTRYNTDFYVVKARIKNAMGAYDAALECADKALESKPELVDAMEQKALALFGLKRYQDASDMLGEMSLNDSENPYCLMLRAWILAEYLKQPEAAAAFYERVLDIDIPWENVKSLRGFALLYLGRNDEARRWIDDILKSAPNGDGEEQYYGACFYAQAGDNTKALECMESALKLGYANYYNWKYNDYARINVAPLRSLPQFEELLKRYAIIFQ